MKHLLPSVLLLLTLLPACQGPRVISEADPPEETRLIYPTFTAETPLMRVADSRWDTGDRIGIFSPRESDLPYVTAHGDGHFAPATEARITMDAEGDSFIAYYPYQDGDTSKLSIDLREQQPVLFARGKGAKGEREVELSFSHRLAQLRVEIDSQIEGLDLSDMQVELQGYLSEGSMEKRTGKITGGAARETLHTTRMGNTFSAYILPGEEIGGEGHQVSIGIGGHRVTLREPAIQEASTYESGRYYLITLHIKPQEPTPEPGPMTGGVTASIRAFVEGGSIEGDILIPTVPDERGGVILEEHFEQDLGQMTSYASLGRGLHFEVDEGAATISGHGLGITEYYLVSPLLDLRETTAATLSFAHSITGGGSMMKDHQELLMTTDRVDPKYPEAASWQKVEIPNYPDGTADFVANSIPIPEEFLGRANVRFAFRYRSTEQSEALWRIDDLILRTKGGGGVQTDRYEPEPPVGEMGLLFPGADCEDESAFRAALGKHKMRGYAVLSRDHDSPERGRVLSVTKSMPGNDYLLSFKGALPSGSRRLSFYLKGSSSDRSMSINLYTDKRDTKGQQDYITYNLGDVRSSDLTLEPGPRNLYKGTIDTRGKWIRVTLLLPSHGLNGDPEGELLAIKLGGKSEVRLMLDHFTVE